MLFVFFNILSAFSLPLTLGGHRTGNARFSLYDASDISTRLHQHLEHS